MPWASQGVQPVLMDCDRVVRHNERSSQMHRGCQERIFDGAARCQLLQVIYRTSPGFLDQGVGLGEGVGSDMERSKQGSCWSATRV
jgi:hypothetical protein